MSRPVVEMNDAVDEMIRDMRDLMATLKAGGMAAVRKKFRVTGGPPGVLPPPTYDPAGVRAVRAAVGVSQPLFAELIGASAAAVKAWEQGTKVPSSMARRLLAEVAADPARWRAKLTAPAPA